MFQDETYDFVNGIIISYTINGEQCMTSCVKQNGEFTCKTERYRSANCIPGKQESLQYYTSLYESEKSKCSSLCGKFGYSYTWCFTDDIEEWDYCSPMQTNYGTSSLKPCQGICKRFGGNTAPYQCKVGVLNLPDIVNPKQNDFYDFCSPNPINLTEFIIINNLIKKYTKDSIFLQKLIKPISRQTQLNGVEELASKYENLYPLISSRNHQNNAIKCIEIQAPPLDNHQDELITLLIKAIIRKHHIDDTSKTITENIINLLSTQGFNLTNTINSTTILTNEENIKKFFEKYPEGYITCTIVIAYGNLDSSRIPTGFALRIKHFDDNNVLEYDSGDRYFSNDMNL
ncbi:hypothetical protein O3M35_003441 [Rhynocoris fuscipes]|uniref:Uncharacterized protein n=1 Tax=Rhynocoris fuscipes TaxID=488301 RepID=A0AAW1CLD3_9HEMI